MKESQIRVISIAFMTVMLFLIYVACSRGSSSQPSAVSVDSTSGDVLKDVTGGGGCCDVKIITIGGQKYVLVLGSSKAAICPVSHCGEGM